LQILFDDPLQDRFLAMQAVFRLVENRLGVGFKSLFVDFLV
jgi:hypothetical protein